MADPADSPVILASLSASIFTQEDEDSCLTIYPVSLQTPAAPFLSCSFTLSHMQQLQSKELGAGLGNKIENSETRSTSRTATPKLSASEVEASEDTLANEQDDLASEEQYVLANLDGGLLGFVTCCSTLDAIFENIDLSYVDSS